MDSASIVSEITTLKCPISDCTWSYESPFDVAQSFKLIDYHMDKEHASPHSPATTTATTKTPKLCPPRIDVGVDPETWQAFTIRWKQYCQGSHIGVPSQSLHLFLCASEALGNLLLVQPSDNRLYTRYCVDRDGEVGGDKGSKGSGQS